MTEINWLCPDDPQVRLFRALTAEGVHPSVVYEAVTRWPEISPLPMSLLADDLEHAQARGELLAVCPTCASFWVGKKPHKTAWWLVQTGCWACGGDPIGQPADLEPEPEHLTLFGL